MLDKGLGYSVHIGQQKVEELPEAAARAENNNARDTIEAQPDH